MKIAFVYDTFLKGRGGDVAVYELAKRLGKRHEVYVLAGETNIKEEGFKFIRLDLPKLFTGKIRDFSYFYKMIKLRRQIKKIQAKYHFDVFNVFHSSLNPAFIGLPTVVTWLGSPRTDNLARKLLNRGLLLTLGANKKTVVISRFLKSQLGFLKNVCVIYCGISQEFSPGKGADKGYMLYVGRLEKHKRVDEAIRVSKELGFPLKVGGYGPEEKNLKKLASEIKAPVEFLGFVPDEKLIKLYQECSFFISASEWEGFGLIFVEAGACKKPSVAYRRGSIPEVIIDGETGFLADNFSQFKEKAQTLVQNKAVREEMGKNAFSFSRNFSWDRGVSEYEKIFLEVTR